ncbi:MAG: hypothetical protein OWQ54_02315 [Sulfolobaceae archaeon]|nr:hypothetical protein [Sulfolobaceae archaeon]
MSKVSYGNIVDLLSKYSYTPAVAVIQLISLISVYAAGMEIAIYHLPLIGSAITAHIYSAAIVVILGLLLFAAAMRTDSLMLKSLSLLNALFCVIAAFEGLFYFGGYTFPIYAFGMGIGFLGVLFTNAGVILYAIKH